MESTIWSPFPSKKCSIAIYSDGDWLRERVLYNIENQQPLRVNQYLYDILKNPYHKEVHSYNALCNFLRYWAQLKACKIWSILFGKGGGYLVKYVLIVQQWRQVIQSHNSSHNISAILFQYLHIEYKTKKGLSLELPGYIVLTSHSTVFFQGNQLRWTKQINTR